MWNSDECVPYSLFFIFKPQGVSTSIWTLLRSLASAESIWKLLVRCMSCVCLFFIIRHKAGTSDATHKFLDGTYIVPGWDFVFAGESKNWWFQLVWPLLICCRWDDFISHRKWGINLQKMVNVTQIGHRSSGRTLYWPLSGQALQNLRFFEVFSDENLGHIWAYYPLLSSLMCSLRTLQIIQFHWISFRTREYLKTCGQSPRGRQWTRQ